MIRSELTAILQKMMRRRLAGMTIIDSYLFPRDIVRQVVIPFPRFILLLTHSFSRIGGSLPDPEWIDAFLDVSDVASISPTYIIQQLQPSPWLSRIMDLVLQHSGERDELEAHLDSFCRKFLIKLTPLFASQVLRSLTLNSPEASIRFFRWAATQRGFPGHELQSYTSLITCLTKSVCSKDDRSRVLIRDLLNEIKCRQLHMTPSASTSLIRSLGGASEGVGTDVVMVEELLIVWRLMKDSGVQPSVFTYNCLLHALVNSTFINSAEKVFSLMQKERCYHVRPNIITYNIMIKGYCNIGKTHLALDKFNSISTSNHNAAVEPDKITYMTLIQAHYSDGEFDACFKLYLEMEEKDLEIPLHAYSLVISGLCKSGKSFQAHSLFDKMRSREVGRFKGSVPIYTALIDCFAKNGNEEQALKLFDMMNFEGFEPDGVTYSVLINCLCKFGKLDKAMEWFRFCQENGVMINAVFYSKLIDGFGKAGRVDEAEKLFEEMMTKECIPDSYCYNGLIRAFCRVGNIEQAMSLFKRMETEGCDQTVYTFTILLDGLLRKHKNEDALRLWDVMIDKGITPTPASFRTLSTGLCLSGKVERACRILDEMAPMGVIPRTAHEDMIKVLCKAGRIQQACKLADEIVNKGREIPAKVRTIFINALRKAGNADLAIKLLHSKIGIGYDRFGSVKKRVKFQTLHGK